MYSDEAEKANHDIYNDFKLKKISSSSLSFHKTMLTFEILSHMTEIILLYIQRSATLY